MTHYLWLFPVGLFAGAYGTLIGAGGAFVLIPILLVAYPSDPTSTIASISLAVVFFNATSGTIAYARMRRVDYKSALLFSCATVPGAVLGASMTHLIARRTFDAVLGLLLIVGAIVLFASRASPGPSRAVAAGRFHFARVLVDRSGETHRFAYNPVLGLVLSFAAALLSGLLGLGGGIFHVPLLTQVLDFPVHIATATSHLTIAIFALAGTLTHIATGSFGTGFRRTIVLAIGVVIGAQFGAWLSGRIRERRILKALALALAVVGVRLVVGAFQ